MGINLERHQIRCQFCGKLYPIIVRPGDIDRFLKKEDLIQNIFPYLSADERELLKSGMCHNCWDMAFLDVEDE